MGLIGSTCTAPPRRRRSSASDAWYLTRFAESKPEVQWRNLKLKAKLKSSSSYIGIKHLGCRGVC